MKERREGEDYVFEDGGSVRIVLTMVREDRGELWAVVRPYYLNGRGPQPLIAPSRLNLVAPRSRAEMARALAAREAVPGMVPADWYDLIEQVCGRTYVLWERGDPAVDLSEVEAPAEELRYAVEPILIDGETVVWAADGGSGKSTLAGALALSLVTGRTLVPGWRPRGRRSVLYLDWESNAREHRRRLEALARAAGQPDVPAGILYRSSYRALADDLAQTQREVAQHGIGAVIVDSAVPASGDDIKDTLAPRQLFNALRSLGDGVARLVLTHLSKSEAERTQGRARALGSVMYENLARSVWELRRSDHGGAGELVVGFFHQKTNGGQLRDAFALRVRYGEDERPLRVEPVAIVAYPDLEERLPVKDRLHGFLASGERTTPEIAERLGVSAAAALRILKRRPDVIQLSPGGGRNNPATWGLAAGGGWMDD